MRVPLASAAVPYLVVSGAAALVCWWGWRHAGPPALSVLSGILAVIG